MDTEIPSEAKAWVAYMRARGVRSKSALFVRVCERVNAMKPMFADEAPRMMIEALCDLLDEEFTVLREQDLTAEEVRNLRESYEG